MNNKNGLSNEQSIELLNKLKTRFEQNMDRHKNLEWDTIEARLQGNPEKLWSLFEMERTGGEPDVVGINAQTKQFLFFDCSQQSPLGRRSLCYDRNALNSRVKYKPANSALDVADSMGITILTEADYLLLQSLGDFDTKTSSWIFTPADVRSLGGALYGDRRYDRVFFYHNGADSYYASRGFRGKLEL